MEMNEKELFHEIRLPWSDQCYVHPICLNNRQTDSLTLSIIPFQVCSGVLEHKAGGLGLPRRRFRRAAAPRRGSDSRTRFHGGVISRGGSAAGVINRD